MLAAAPTALLVNYMQVVEDGEHADVEEHVPVVTGTVGRSLALASENSLVTTPATARERRTKIFEFIY